MTSNSLMEPRKKSKTVRKIRNLVFTMKSLRWTFIGMLPVDGLRKVIASYRKTAVRTSKTAKLLLQYVCPTVVPVCLTVVPVCLSVVASLTELTTHHLLQG